MTDYRPIVERIEAAMAAVRPVVARYDAGRIAAERKAGGDPVTAADLELDAVLRETLLRPGEGWLSEETVDDAERLAARWVWIVDPLDGTREFVEGLDEWCISIGLAEDGQAVAGGIWNPMRDELVMGARGLGVRLNGRSVQVRETSGLASATVLASRTEVRRGQWQRFEGGPFTVVAMGSVAYKLARVAAGLDDATFTLVPKNEWDVAAGTALVEAAGGIVRDTEGRVPRFNRARTLLPGLVAAGPGLFDTLTGQIEQVQERGDTA